MRETMCGVPVPFILFALFINYLGSFHDNGCGICTKIAMFGTVKNGIFINQISIITVLTEYTIDNLNSQYKGLLTNIFKHRENYK